VDKEFIEEINALTAKLGIKNRAELFKEAVRLMYHLDKAIEKHGIAIVAQRDKTIDLIDLDSKTVSVFTYPFWNLPEENSG
jgi:metal-responsive CopG/Arc/MetJ family transcriptional regulator